MAAVVHHDAIAADSARNGDRNSGSGGSQPSSTAGQTHRRARKAIIESDPEDEEDMSMSAARPSGTSNHASANLKESTNPGANMIRNGARASSRLNNSSQILNTSSENMSGIESTLPSTSGAQATTVYTMDTDISQLEAPTFTTLDRGPSQTMIDLTWDHKVNLIGKKVVNPMIHNCDKCKKPILIYGRMIPCKHVFCLSCATQSLTPSATSTCPRCSDKVVRVEQAGLGSIYMCSHGGSRYGSNGCRRTYLSQRDLQAHIQHRHIKQQQTVLTGSTPATAAQSLSTQQNAHNSSNSLLGATASQLPSAQEIAAATAAIVANRKRQEHQQHPVQQAAIASVTGMPQHSHAPSSGYQQPYSHPPPHQGSSSSSYPYSAAGQIKHQQSNLITVPIQDNVTSIASGNSNSVPTYSGTSQTTQWTSQAANAASNYSPAASSYYHTGSNSGGNNTPSVIGGYNTAHSVPAVGHPHHASHHQAHHQSGVSGQMLMSSTAQWNSQPNNRTSGVDRTASSVDHIRGSNERTSGGYRR